MSLSEHGEARQTRPSNGDFSATHWSVVLAAGRADTTHARSALETLCRSYWQPIYAFVRRQGRNHHEAEDLTQEFFSRLLLYKNYLGDVSPVKGRFRSFLLASIKNFLANEWDKARAQKRGGGNPLIPLDTELVESREAFDRGGPETPDQAFERQWALTLLGNVMFELKREYVASNKSGLFEELKFTLTDDSTSVPYAEVARRLKLSEGAVKVAVHRLRGRYRDILKAQIAQTVSTPEELEDEVRALFATFAK